MDTGISLWLNRHGDNSFGCSADQLDAAIAKYLPASPSKLRAIVTDRVDGSDCFLDIKDVSSFLIILADLDDELEQAELFQARKDAGWWQS